MTLEEMIAVLTAAKEDKKLVSTLGSPIDSKRLLAEIEHQLDRIIVAPSPIAVGHNPNQLTEDQVGVKDGWRLLSEEEFEYRQYIAPPDIGVSDWKFCTEDLDLWMGSYWSTEAVGNLKEYTYRTKKPPGFFLPKPKERKPLGPEDFPPGTFIRCSKEWPKVPWFLYAITDIGLSVRWPDVRRAHSWMDLTILYLERSLDGGKTWLPCYKEE